MKKLNKATLIIITSMLVLALTLVATFSWFPRAATADESTVYATINVRPVGVYTKANTASVTTYKGEFINGQISNEKPLDDSNKTFTIQSNACVYFQSIVIDNTSSHNNVSLTGLTLTPTTGDTSSIKVCMLSPLKTTQTYSDGMTIAEHISTVKSADAAAIVEWYLYNSGSTEVKVTMTAPTVSISE